MIIKLEKVISCTSEHPSYPAANLLQQRTNASWRCAKPGELLASLIFQLAEPSAITGLDIGNYRSCIVVITASTTEEPDNWIPIINHQFMTHEEAANGKFKDQVQLFTKKELKADTLRTKFSRVKVTCMQSANRRELFGLTFVVLRTEVTLQLGADIFGRFKLKDDKTETLDDFKAKCMKQVAAKPQSYRESLAQKVKEEAANNFAKRQESPKELPKRPILDKLEKEERKEGEKEERKEAEKEERKEGEEEERPDKAPSPDKGTPLEEAKNSEPTASKMGKTNAKRRSPFEDASSDDEARNKARGECPDCAKNVAEDTVCRKCGGLPPQKPLVATPRVKKPRVVATPLKEFHKLLENVSFALSGYVNPRRDEIRKKALKMGARYVADPNTTTNRCSHLVCAFKNTPKAQQLRHHTRIVTHKFIEDCYEKKKRLPWRRFAIDARDKAESESEEEIEGTTSRIVPPDPYKQDTDFDSDD